MMNYYQSFIPLLFQCLNVATYPPFINDDSSPLFDVFGNVPTNKM